MNNRAIHPRSRKRSATRARAGSNPAAVASYDRTARVAMTPTGPIRLMLDRNLRALPAAGLWFSERGGTAILPDEVIVELKFRREAPVLFKYLIADFALNPRVFSKYRLAAASLGLVNEPALATDPEPRLAYA